VLRQLGTPLKHQQHNRPGTGTETTMSKVDKGAAAKTVQIAEEAVDEMRVALSRIMRGEAAVLVIHPRNWAAAEALHQHLPEAVRARLTLVRGEA
jgi:hypothetical protein